MQLVFTFFESLPKDMLINLKEREREREREREKRGLVASHPCPDQGSDPKPRRVP